MTCHALRLPLILLPDGRQKPQRAILRLPDAPSDGLAWEYLVSTTSSVCRIPPGAVRLLRVFPREFRWLPDGKRAAFYYLDASLTLADGRPCRLAGLPLYLDEEAVDGPLVIGAGFVDACAALRPDAFGSR